METFLILLQDIYINLTWAYFFPIMFRSMLDEDIVVDSFSACKVTI